MAEKEYIEREAVNALIKAECSPKVAAYLIDAVATIPAADAIEELSKLHETQKRNLSVLTDELMRRWIPVTERLPENDQDVLVMVHWRDYPENMMCYGRKYKTRWYLWNGELGELIKGFDITHWMPLPEPPKEE